MTMLSLARHTVPFGWHPLLCDGLIEEEKDGYLGMAH